MAKKANGVSKSEEIRRVLQANRSMKAKDVVNTLAEKGIQVTDALVYFVKGQMKGRKARKQKVAKTVALVAETTHSVDPVSLILKVKGLAAEVGGMKKLKALVEVLS
jgi:arginine repressor